MTGTAIAIALAGVDEIRARYPMLLRPQHVAEILDLRVSRIYQMLSEGGLPGVVHIGRSVRVQREALIAAYFAPEAAAN